MKICLVLPEYLPVPAVCGGAVETLTEELIKYNEKYKEVEIYCITKYNKEAIKLINKYPNTHFITVNFFEKGAIDFFLKAINYIIRSVFKFNIRKYIRENIYNRKIKEANCDLIIFEGANSYINPKLVDNLGKENLVLHLHKVYQPNFEWERYYGNFISISKYVTNEFCKDGTISYERVHTVLNGVEKEKFIRTVKEKDLTAIKEKCGIKKDDCVLLYTGRLLPEKGVKELIIAFKKMKKKNKCKLIIVGSSVSNNNQDTEYTKVIKKLSENEKIIFTGYVPNNELYKYYQLADIAIFPSTGPEGLGLVVIEAMLSKLPTIITNSGGMPELVTTESSVVIDLDEKLINNLSDKMDILVNDKNLRKQMGESGYKIAQSFDSETYYKNYITALKNIKNSQSN